jgi:bifunctional DNA-binding transcriptional regulator/antitoxin component of YhaV-PrlF toxin-antitoxin module
MEWLASKGAHIFVPVGHSPDVDFVAELGGRTLRIEVKTSTCQTEGGNWAVVLSTRGGNQSWTGLVKYFDRGRCDYLFVHVGDGRRWFIPAMELEGRSAIHVGGMKYSEFEVEPGQPMPTRLDDPRLESVEEPGEYPSGQRGCAVNAMALPSQVRILPPPSDSVDAPEPPAVGRTRMSANHQVTVPMAVAAASSIEPGDRFRVESDGTGRFVMTRIEEYMERHVAQWRFLTTLSRTRGAGASSGRTPLPQKRGLVFSPRQEPVKR